MYKKNFIYRRVHHHSLHSGYDRLLHYIDGNKINNGVSSGIFSILPDRLLNFALRKSYIVGYNKARLISEIRVGLKFIGIKKEIFHFLNGEIAYCYSGFLPRSKNKKIICTFHQPQERFEKLVGRRKHLLRHLLRLDGIVVVSRCQSGYFEKIVGREKVFFVPHGIDTDFFTPPQKNVDEESSTCLFVGNWLRDFEMLNEVMQKVYNKNRKIKFQIATPKKNVKFIDKISNANIYSGISELELFNLYQKASLLVIPLLNCTANNSILEGLACGLPIVTTDVGGVRDYLDESCAVFVKPRESEMMAEKILALLENRQAREIMGKNARKQALKLSWPLISQKLDEVYSRLFS